jgi:hypothetical protein
MQDGASTHGRKWTDAMAFSFAEGYHSCYLCVIVVACQATKISKAG